MTGTRIILLKNLSQIASTAPFVESGAFHNIIHSQWHSMFHTVDTFVLGAVVHKGAPDVLHARYKLDIGDKDTDPDYALQNCHHILRCDKAGKQSREKQGEKHENSNCKDKGQHHDKSHKRTL